MKNKSNLFLFAALVLMLGFTYYNFQSALGPSLKEDDQEEVFEISSIKSLTLVSKEDSYQLNPLDQVEVLDILSSGLKLKTHSFNSQKPISFTFEKIIVEKQDGNKLVLTPEFIMDENIVFSVPTEKDFNYIIERSHGKLFNLLKGSNI